MSSQKRMILFLALSISLMAGTQFLLDRLGFNPPPPKPPAVPPVANQGPAVPAPVPSADAKKGGEPAAADDAKKTETAKTEAPKSIDPPTARSGELRIGSSEPTDDSGYHLQVEFDQRGAGVRQVFSSQYNGETADAVPDRKTPLHLIRPALNDAPTAFSLTIRPVTDGASAGAEIPLDYKLWEVVRETPDGPAVRGIRRAGVEASVPPQGQEIKFRHTLEDLGVTVTKTFRIWKGDDGFEVELDFVGKKDAKLVYRIFGPHGIPIEGEWYTSNFRDVFFGLTDGKSTTVMTKTASEIVKARENPEIVSTKPIKFAGVENQYFAVFLQPFPLPTSLDDRRDKEAMAFVAREDRVRVEKSDVGVELTSLPVVVGPNAPVKHGFRVFAGPKIASALSAYEATELATYRKWQLITIPFATEMATYVIAPLLKRMYDFTAWVARLFGGTSGNYGVAIILLTMTVRLLMFPIGRKQAMIAKKMQDLQPQLMAIKEKYKDDKEAQTRETLAFYKKTGFNPAAGCLPALIQMPIFVGLWQALNNSVALRHSTFLYIKNLAAPDMLFKFPVTIPYIGDFFNLLPFFVVALMLLQTKLFTPPPTTEEARMQQKMMKYMMIFMAFMFYRVPSGLGLYFITSSTWQICERLILPKLAERKKAKQIESGELVETPIGGSFNLDGKSSSVATAPEKGGWLTRKLEKLLEEAEQQRTIRNNPNMPPESPATAERRTNRPKPPGGGKRR